MESIFLAINKSFMESLSFTWIDIYNETLIEYDQY